MGGSSIPTRRPLSVIVAGATGCTGSAVVANLVSHPRVDRVVALSRHSIPVDRWSTAFPGIRMADALRHLCVVEMDYTRLLSDALTVQLRPIIPDTEEDIGPFPALEIDASKSVARNGGRGRGRRSATETAAENRRNAINKVSRDYYYRSVFVGHQVAINCLGSHELLWRGSVATVDLHYSLAFATMVRLFDTSSEAVGGLLGPRSNIGEANLATMERQSVIAQSLDKLRDLDTESEVWREVHAMCLGKRVDGSASDAAAALGVSGAIAAVRQAVSQSTMLEQFVQISTVGASPSSLVPYFRHHGLRDEALRKVFGGPSTSSCFDVVIWRPGLLARRERTRWFERALSTVIKPLEVKVLGELIVDDIIARAEKNEQLQQHASSSGAVNSSTSGVDFTVFNSVDIEAMALAKRFSSS